MLHRLNLPKKWVLLFFLYLPLLSTSQLCSAGSLFDSLAPDQQKEILLGKQVAMSKTVPGSDWPLILVYQGAHLSPEEGIAYAGDYLIHPLYFEKIKSIKLLSQPEPITQFLEYTIKIGLPFWDEEKMNMTEKIGYNSRTEIYSLRIDMQKSGLLTEGKAALSIEALGNEALLGVSLYVVPTPMFSGIVRASLLDQTKTMVKSIVAKTEDMVREQSQKTQDQVEKLRKRLNNLGVVSKP